MSPMSSVVILITSIVTFPNIDPVTSSSLTVPNCTTNTDCEPNLCCLLGPSRYSIPACMPFQQEGEQCRVNAKTITTNLSYPDNTQIEVKDIHFILCACADGLSCDPKDGICKD
ncbi:astakine [Mycetomoellerius zeteki]|nr:PREDICTED: astakine-like [Trachymyrmex zeteki]